MVKVYAIHGVIPVVDPSAYVHPSAVLIGDAIVGAGCYVGPGAVMRGDFGRVILEAGANLQDTCVMHSFPGVDCVVGKGGHIGHGAVLHGCRIGDDALVGMNAVVMDGAVVGESALVAAMALVRQGFTVPPRMLAAGSPARLVRQLSDEEIAWKREGTADYQRLAVRSLRTMRLVDALAAVEPGRPQVDAGDSVPLYATKQRD